jgi:long-chain fatty acid transport protein
MNTRHTASTRSATLAAGLISFLFSLQCSAGAAWLTESGSADMAMASAGRAAFATDSTTIAANPAGMLALNGSTVSVAVMPIGLDLRFHGDGETPGNVVNEQGTVPTMSAFAARHDSRWALGLGAYGNVGLGCDFGKEWSGRRAIEDAQLRSFNLVPAVAYSLDDRLGIGASIGAQYADAKAGMAVSGEAIYYGPPLDLPDGQLHMTGHSWAPVANLGLVYETDDGTRLGLAWTSTVDHSLDLDVRASAVHPLLASMLQQQEPAQLNVRLPQQFTLSAVRQVAPATLLAASIGWQQWSGFGDARLRIAGQGRPMFEDGLDDTWNVAVGLRHSLDPRWTLAAGIAYDTDPGSNGTMPIYFPMAEQLRLAAGADYQYSETLLLRVALSVISQGDVRIAQDSHPVPLPGIPSVTGTISGSRIYALAFTADYRP